MSHRPCEWMVGTTKKKLRPNKIIPTSDDEDNHENYESKKTAVMAPIIVSAIVMGFLVVCLVVLIISFWWGHKKSNIGKAAVEKLGISQTGNRVPSPTSGASSTLQQQQSADAQIQHINIGEDQEIILDVVGSNKARSETCMMRVESLLRSR